MSSSWMELWPLYSWSASICLGSRSGPQSVRGVSKLIAGSSLFEFRLFPPREERGHVRGHFVGELRGTLLEEGGHAFVGVLGLAARLNGAAVDAMRFHRVRRRDHAPHQLSGQRDGYRSGIVGDLASQLVGRRQQLVGRVQGAYETSVESLLSVEHAARH